MITQYCNGDLTGYTGPMRDHCYWCRNEVTPVETSATWDAASTLDTFEVAAMRAELDAAGRDPSLAGVILRRARARATAAWAVAS